MKKYLDVNTILRIVKLKQFVVASYLHAEDVMMNQLQTTKLIDT
jgi:hypothetical protein